MRHAVARLESYATRRLSARDEAPSLFEVAKRALAQHPCEDLLVPESMSLGYATPLWSTLRDEERLALNHWLYVMHYTRITDGEVTVIAFNGAIAAMLSQGAPLVSALLALESAEEQDHIRAFRLVMDQVKAHHGLGGLRFPVKPLRRLLIEPRLAEALSRYFGADYMVTYFLGRGLINHMGRGFERGVSQTHSARNQALHALTAEHALHESHHTSVSHLLSEGAREVYDEDIKAGMLYQVLHHALRRVTVQTTFSETLTKRQERAMSAMALRQMPALRHRSDDFLAALIDAHFNSLSGVEQAKNEHIPRPNARIMSRAAMALSHKRQWVRWMRADCDNLRFFPHGWEPIDAASSPSVDVDASVG